MLHLGVFMFFDRGGALNYRRTRLLRMAKENRIVFQDAESAQGPGF
jgi:hypothetical protein